MASDRGYIIALTCDSDLAPEARARLENNAALNENARLRAKYGGDERRLSVGAGVLIVIMLILYSLGARVGAVIAGACLAAYAAAAAVYIAIKRRRLRRVPQAVSPRRAADALLREALSLARCDRELADLFDMARLDEFSRRLRAELTARAGECGVTADSWSLETDIAPTGATGLGDGLISAPLVARVSVSGAGGECRFYLECMADFVCGSGGDFAPVDCAPAISAVVPFKFAARDIPARDVEFIKCPACGAYQSKRCAQACENRCVKCGAAIPG